jgi:hypothetical protein
MNAAERHASSNGTCPPWTRGGPAGAGPLRLPEPPMRCRRSSPAEMVGAASARYGWPLHVVEDAGDEPFLDQPEAFLDVLRLAVGGAVVVS